MLDYVWWVIGGIVVLVILWRFGWQASVFALLGLFGVKILRDERERGRADQRSEDAQELEELRDDWQEIDTKPHSPDDAYDHLRGLSDDDRKG